MTRVKLVAICACIAFFANALNAKDFSIQKNSHIGFAVKKFGVMNVEGNFKEFSGTLSLDDKDNIIALQGEVLVRSIFSDNAKRDKHLLEADFLDANKFPTMNLVMLSYTPQNTAQNKTQKGKMIATLSLHGKKKKVEFESVLDMSSGAPQLTLQSAINIKEFNIKGSAMNANKVNIIIKTKWQER